MSYWYPQRVRQGGLPMWCWLIPLLWPLLLTYYAIRIVLLAFWLLVSIPVNLMRLVIHRSAAPRYDEYTGERVR